jgi:hypothetical protein
LAFRVITIASIRLLIQSAIADFAGFRVALFISPEAVIGRLMVSSRPMFIASRHARRP